MKTLLISLLLASSLVEAAQPPTPLPRTGRSPPCRRPVRCARPATTATMATA